MGKDWLDRGGLLTVEREASDSLRRDSDRVALLSGAENLGGFDDPIEENSHLGCGGGI
jgi:hypothetical protein